MAADVGKFTIHRMRLHETEDMRREQEIKQIFSKGLDDPRKKLGVLTEDVPLAFGHQAWPKGTEVLAWKIKGRRGGCLCIERVKWKKPYLPLFNQVAGVLQRQVKIQKP